MAWDVAAYGITAAVLAIAAALVAGIVRICRSLKHLDRAVEVLSRESETSLRHCRELADEARAAIVVSKQSLQGFATLAEGARALGEAVQSAAQAAAHITAFCRERLTSPMPATSEHRDQAACEMPELTEIGRSLWSLWKRKTGKAQTSDCRESSGQSADPSQGE